MTRLFLFCLLCTVFFNELKAQQENSKFAIPKSDLWLTYSGSNGPGKGKHVVLIAAEQEYRSEQSMPMLAKVLSRHHGFDCTVLLSLSTLFRRSRLYYTHEEGKGLCVCVCAGVQFIFL